MVSNLWPVYPVASPVREKMLAIDGNFYRGPLPTSFRDTRSEAAFVGPFRFVSSEPKPSSLDNFVSCHPKRKCFRILCLAIFFCRLLPSTFVAFDCSVFIFNTRRVNSILTKLVVKWNLCLSNQPTILSPPTEIFLT